MKKLMRQLGPYVISSVLSLVIVLVVFRTFHIDPKLPLNYSNDALVHYNFAKNIQETGWWAKNPYLSAPIGQTFYDFPLTENFQLLLIKLLILTGLNWYQSVNGYFILTFPLIVIVSLYIFKKLGVQTSPAIALSIIFSFLPYHFYRGVNHLFLSGYYVVPLAVYISIRLAQNKPLKLAETLIMTLLVASTGAYYTFFSILFMLAGSAIAIVTNRDKKTILYSVLTLFLVVSFFFLNYLPTFIYTVKYGNNLTASTRLARDTEVFGLKIAQLVLPFEDHRLELFNKIQKRYMEYGSVNTNENQGSALGVVGGVGFIFLLVWSIFRPGVKNREDNLGATLAILGIFNLIAILFSTVGGFSSLFSTYLDPTIRSVNRVSVFVAYISLTAVGLSFQRIKRLKLTYFFSGLILVLALLDQISLGVMRNFMRNPTKYYSNAEYAKAVEDVAGENAKVFTLPFGQYPTGSDKKIMQLALLTEGIYWSTGAERWRAANYWQFQTANLEAKELLKKITEEGFTGLMISVKDLDLTTQDKIQKEVSINPIRDTEGDFNYYDLRSYIKDNNISFSPQEVFHYVSGNCMFDRLASFYCIKSGLIQLENVSGKNLTKTLRYTLTFPEGKSENITQSTEIPAGKSHHQIIRNTGNKVFPIPKSVPIWPIEAGYPTFIISNIELL